MDDQTLTHIFDPFFTTKETGRGLGLAAVQGIIRGHHGALTVHSEPEVGARFQVLLPNSHDQTIPAEIVEESQDESSKSLILVVDDEADVRSAISDALTFLGHQILLAENGEEALTLYQNHAPEIDLILLDITMPVLSGKETLTILEKRQLAVPVILMSGYEEQKQEGSQQSKNVVGFLKKPFRIDRMMNTINSALTPSSNLKTSV
jgi:CheY-like chemotaxis protein